MKFRKWIISKPKICSLSFSLDSSPGRLKTGVCNLGFSHGVEWLPLTPVSLTYPTPNPLLDYNSRGLNFNKTSQKKKSEPHFCRSSQFLVSIKHSISFQQNKRAAKIPSFCFVCCLCLFKFRYKWSIQINFLQTTHFNWKFIKFGFCALW